MTAYNVPLYLYISTEDFGLYSIHIDGLETQSFYDCVKDLYEWNELEKRNLKEYSDVVGVDYYFVKSIDIGDNGVDSVLIRSGNFYLEIPPYTTRTISLRLTSFSSIDTWFTCPNEWLPIVEQQNRLVFFDGSNSRSWWDFCCWHAGVEFMLNGVGIGASIFSMLFSVEAAATMGAAAAAGATALVPTPASPVALSTAGALLAAAEADASMALATALLSCVASALATSSSEIANGLCGGEIKTRDRAISWGGLVMGCLSGPFSTIGSIPSNIASVISMLSGVYSMAHNEVNPCTDGNSNGGHSTAVTPLDPNDIRGYLSESGSHYMRQEIQNVQYEIEFENDTTLATAAAHTIIVRDTLDATKFDLNSLAARSVTIGDKRLELNGEQTFARTLDMRPELYVIAQIEQDYDPTTGIVEWTIQSLDPMTMEPTDNPYQGVLPVNYSGNGVGFIDYSINLKQAFADGTAISNRAGIIFDQNDVIMTPTWTNVVDAETPTSYIEEVTPMADSLNFVFVSQDNRSGVWYHSLYYRNASTDQEWQVRKAQIFEDSFVLHLEDLLTTEYLVIAVDSAGNREDKDMVAEYIYTASGLHFVTEGNWSNDSNWEDCTMPGINDVVFIDASCQLDQDAEVAVLVVADGQTLTVQSGKTLTVNGLLSNTSAEGLVIEDGAQIVNASANVAATLKKDVQAYNNGDAEGWYTIASPMNGMAIEGSGYVTPEYDLYRYNETNLNGEEWENYKANLADFTTFEKGRGYLFANSNSFSPVFIGTLNNMDVTCSLTYTNRPNDPLSGFNLIGNPFPHNIYKGSGAAIDNVNLASGYYTLTNEGTWQAHTFEDAILPGQGILVKATAPTVLTIAKSTAVATSETGGAKRETGALSISVKGENGQDQAFVYFGRGNSMEKMGGFVAQEPRLWVRDNGKDYAIAHMEKACETLELCFSCKQVGDFTLTVDRNETEFEYLQLVDHVTGLTVDLLKQPAYVFQAAGQEPEARFSIRFKVAE